MVIDRLFPIARWLPACSWPRALAKTLTWRFFATLDTFLISILVTKNLKLAGSIVGIEVLTKMIWYLLHERAWARLSLAAEPQAAPVFVRASRRPEFRPPDLD